MLLFKSIIKWKKPYSLNLTYNFCALKNLQDKNLWTWTGIRTSDLQITSLVFKEECLKRNWNRNLDSSIGKSARLVIWRPEVWIPVQVQIFLLKFKKNMG